LELTEQVAAAVLFAVVQGVELRENIESISPALQNTIRLVREISPSLLADRALENELRACLVLIRQQHWPLYD
jgi:histidine ammonia-lyase